MTATVLAAVLTIVAVLVHNTRRRPDTRHAGRSAGALPSARLAALRERWVVRKLDPLRVWAGAADTWAAELTAGSSPTVGLVHALESGTPAMQRAGRSIALGADAGEALDALSKRPGHADGAAALCACWWIAVSVGGAAALTVQRVADSLRDEIGVRAEIRAQLAAPRATAQLVAALPLAGPLLGALLGVDTFQVLIGTSPGRALLMGGLVLNAVGVLWVHRLIRSAEAAA